MDEPRELGQSEIDALLNGLSNEAEEDDLMSFAVSPATPASLLSPLRSAVKLYDFRRPDKLSKDQVRTLHLIHQNLARLIASALSAKARVVVQASLTAIEQRLYREYIDQVTEPSALSVVAMDPLPGKAIIEMSMDIGYLIIDRLLGGPGKPMPRGRTTTEIEVTLLKSIVTSLLFALSETWDGIIAFQPRLEDTTINPQFVQIALPTDVVAVVSFEVRLMGVTGTVNLCIPHTVLEPIIPQLSTEMLLSRKIENTTDQVSAISSHLSNVEIPVSVRLGDARITVNELLELDVGDVLTLEASVNSQLTVTVEGKPKFHARPGSVSSHYAVQITEVLEEESTPLL